MFTWEYPCCHCGFCNGSSGFVQVVKAGTGEVHPSREALHRPRRPSHLPISARAFVAVCLELYLLGVALNALKLRPVVDSMLHQHLLRVT